MNAGEGGVVHVTLRHTGGSMPCRAPCGASCGRCLKASRPATRCVVMAGEGGAFCAGDISEYPGFRFDAAAARLSRKRRVGRPERHAGVRCAHRRQHQRRSHGRGGRDCQLLRCARGGRCGPLLARPSPSSAFPMAPREAQLVAAAVGETAARQCCWKPPPSPPPTCWRAVLSRVVPDDDVPTEALASAQPHCRPGAGAARMNKQSVSSIETPPALDGKSPAAIK